MLLKHQVVGCELWHDVESALVHAETRADEDPVLPEVHCIVARRHEPVADLDVAGLDCLHTDESTLLESENRGAICGCRFREETELVPGHAIIFSFCLSLLDSSK